MPFNRVADHQIKALLLVEDSLLFHKIADMPHIGKARFDIKKPFDCFSLHQVKAYIGICYYKPRKQKELILIRIKDFIKEKDASVRKSLTEMRAKEISEKIIKLK